MDKRSDSNEDEKNKKNEPLMKTLAEGVIASLIASAIMMFVGDVFKYFSKEYSHIFPDLKTLIICSIVFIGLLVLAYIGSGYSEIIGMLLPSISTFTLGVGVFVLLLRLMTLIYILTQETKDASACVAALKSETLLIFIVGYLGILHIFSRKLSMQIQKEEFAKEANSIVTNAVAIKIEDITKDVKSYSNNVGELLKKMDFDTAVTSTVIPFWEKNGSIKTYLIANSSYPKYTWMFPGGHVLFNEEQSPETIAISRAKDEANLTVSILDINSTFDILSADDDQVSNMTVFKPPHFLYLFKLDEKTKCYRDKGHEYHIDVVYVAEVNKEEKQIGDQKRIPVTLSANTSNIDEVNQACHAATRNYYRKNNVKNSERNDVPDYVETMLYNAFMAYKKYKKL